MLHVLKKHNKTIGLILVDIPGISLSMGIHKILFKDGEKSVRHPQRRLNPLILDVFKIETYIAQEDKENTTFTCPFNTFTHRRTFFDPDIKVNVLKKVSKSVNIALSYSMRAHIGRGNCIRTLIGKC